MNSCCMKSHVELLLHSRGSVTHFVGTDGTSVCTSSKALAATLAEAKAFIEARKKPEKGPMQFKMFHTPVEWARSGGDECSPPNNKANVVSVLFFSCGISPCACRALSVCTQAGLKTSSLS